MPILLDTLNTPIELYRLQEKHRRLPLNPPTDIFTALTLDALTELKARKEYDLNPSTIPYCWQKG